MYKAKNPILCLIVVSYTNLVAGMIPMQAIRSAATQAVGEAGLQRAQQAATGFLYLQAARQTARDLANIASVGKEKIERALTSLAANVSQLLDEFNQSIDLVSTNMEGLQNTLEKLRPQLITAYQQSPQGTSVKPPTKGLFDWATTQAGRAISGAGRLYERGAKALYGERLGELGLTPAKKMIGIISSLKNVAERMLDKREYLKEIEPELQNADYITTTLINDLQTMHITMKTLLEIIPVLPQQHSLEKLAQEDTTSNS